MEVWPSSQRKVLGGNDLAMNVNLIRQWCEIVPISSLRAPFPLFLPVISSHHFIRRLHSSGDYLSCDTDGLEWSGSPRPFAELAERADMGEASCGRGI